MLKHYTNSYRENAQEHIDDLTKIGLVASVGDPGASERNTGEQIKALGMGVVGVWIEADEGDTRPGNEIVNAAWTAYFAANPAAGDN